MRQQLTKDDDASALRPHRSLLPVPLYLLSFAEPSHPNTKSPWQDRFTHPYILYALGTLAAIPAGLAFPAMDMLYGHWTTGVTKEGVMEEEIRRTGSQMGWVTTVVGVGVLFFAWVFPICCKSDCSLQEAVLNIVALSLCRIVQIDGTPTTCIRQRCVGARSRILRESRTWGDYDSGE
jgi:hypothetical protein